MKVSVLYADGTSDTKTLSAINVAAAPVTATSSGVSVPFISVIALAVVTAGLAAYGAFGRWRK